VFFCGRRNQKLGETLHGDKRTQENRKNSKVKEFWGLEEYEGFIVNIFPEDEVLYMPDQF
jgi:hypothetical protein